MNDHTSSTLSGPTTSSPESFERTTPAGGAESAAIAGGGEDVLKILASVEEQFGRLRAAKKSQEDAFAAMAERNRLLHQAEQELRQLRQDISQQQQAIQRDRDRMQGELSQLSEQRQRLEQQANAHRQSQSDFDSSRSRWQDERQKAESSFAQREVEIHQRQAEVERHQADLQKERERITGLEKEFAQQREATARRSSELERDHRELTKRVNQAEANVGQLIREIETSQQQLASKNEALERASADSKTLAARIRELEKSLTQTTQRAEKIEREAQEMARLADHERNEQSAKFAAQVKDLHATRDQAKQELTAAREQAASLDKHVRKLQSQIAERDATLADQKQKLEAATAKLSEFATVLSEQTPLLERGAAAQVMVEQQHDQIERLTQQLAEMQLRTSPDEAIRREQRITELTEALRQARGQSVNSLGVADIERRNNELTAEVERLKVEAGNAVLAAEEARRQLKESSAQVTAPQVQDAMTAEQAARIAALSAEIEQLKSNAAAEIKSQVESLVETQVKARLKEQHRKAGESAQAGAAATRELRQRIAELERDLAEAKTVAAATASPDPEAFSAQLRKKAERVTAVAEHLRRRRQRLKKLRVLVHSRGMQKHAAGTANLEELQQEWNQVAEVRRLLAASEQAMIRRWARPRAVNAAVWIAVLAILCAGTSWLLAGQFFPPRMAASVVFQGKTTSGLPMTDEQAAEWRTWHSNLFSDPTFIQTLAKRMGDRRIDAYTDPGNLSKRLGEDLTIDASQPKSLIITLAGSDEDETPALLDIIASTVITESGHQLGNRNDAAWAVSPNERTENGRIRYADLNPVPLKDERLTMALPIFGGLFFAILAFIGVIYTRLLRAKRVFDQDNAALFLDAKTGTA